MDFRGDSPNIVNSEESELESRIEVSSSEANHLKLIRDWLKDNPNINAHTDDLHLLYFLRSCKYELERTKEKMKRFYLMKAERIEWFTNRDPFSPEIQELLNIGVFLPLRVRDDLNRQIFVIRTGAHNPKRHKQNDVFKVGKMILDLAMRIYPEISIYGLVAIFDMQGVELGHALQLTPTIIKRSVESWHLYPAKPKMLEFVNSPIHINMALNVFKAFMSTKMKSRIIVRRGPSAVKTDLPKELGGTVGSYTELAKYWKKKVEDNANFFKYDEKYKTVTEYGKCDSN